MIDSRMFFASSACFLPQGVFSLPHNVPLSLRSRASAGGVLPSPQEGVCSRAIFFALPRGSAPRLTDAKSVHAQMLLTTRPESALPTSGGLKSFEINTCKKKGRGGGRNKQQIIGVVE